MTAGIVIAPRIFVIEGLFECVVRAAIELVVTVIT